MSPDRVLVYAGKGSSHSWTWVADLLESEGAFEVDFVDAQGLECGIGEGASLVIVSGGDGFEIASHFAPRAFAAIEGYVRAGGRYFGVCAGAYLPLPSRLAPLDRFNLSSTRIRNIAGSRDETAERSPRTGLRYGSCSIVHAVRGEVVVGDGTHSFAAPIYGGPVFQEPESDQVMLRYTSFTPKTSFQIERKSAEQVMVGAPAVVSASVGDGTMTLAGPHLEHPGFHEANLAFMRLTRIPCGRTRSRRTFNAAAHSSLDRSLADLKVSILGMERESFLVGVKLWDGGRLLELARAVEMRKCSMDEDTAQAIASLLDDAHENLLSLGPLKVAGSDSAPSKLVEAARLCVNRHFQVLKG